MMKWGCCDWLMGYYRVVEVVSVRFILFSFSFDCQQLDLSLPISLSLPLVPPRPPPQNISFILDLVLLGVHNSISPVSRLQFPHNPSSTDLFQPLPASSAFQSASSPQPSFQKDQSFSAQQPIQDRQSDQSPQTP